MANALVRTSTDGFIHVPDNPGEVLLAPVPEIAIHGVNR
jgi:hypothetical protein